MEPSFAAWHNMKLDINESTKIKLMVTAAISFSAISGCQVFSNYTKKGEPSLVVYDKYYSYSSRSSAIRLNDGESDYFISGEEFDSLLDSGEEISIGDAVFDRVEVEKAIRYYNFNNDRNQSLNIWLPLTMTSVGTDVALLLSLIEFKNRNGASKEKKLEK